MSHLKLVVDNTKYDDSVNDGVDIVYVPSGKFDFYKTKIGIHLINPSSIEIMDAKDRADRDGFPCVYIYTLTDEYI